MFKIEYLKFLCCPDCRGELELKSETLICKSCSNNYPIVESIPVLLPKSIADDVKMSREKWEKEYRRTIDKKKMTKLKNGFKKTYLDSAMKYFNKILKSLKAKRYLEIGSGPFFIGQELAKLGIFAVGIDYSLGATKLAQAYLKEEKIDNYLLVCGDITKMPFKDNVFDLLYGGGVIEHFKDTKSVVKENYRVLKRDGLAFNTVPCLNVGSLTYRQVWGNIPNVPVLRGIAEFVHVKLLKGKHMTYGYEYSFTKANLQKIFQNAGFRKENIEIERFEVPLIFEYIKSKILKNIATKIARSDLFWPVVYIKSIK